MESSATQVKVNFTTTHDDLQLPENKMQLIVPADIKRYGLSRILNSESMLATPSPVPLDFLVNGTFLRTTLEEYLNSEGLSSETTVTLQYVRSLLPPTYETSFEHDDWVSAVDVLSPTSAAGLWTNNDDLPAGGGGLRDRILSASHDGLVRIWDGAGTAVATSAPGRGGGHDKMLTSARFLSANRVASAGLDQKIVLWKYAEAADGSTGQLKPEMELRGHRKMIHALDVHGPSRRILSASADGRVGVWTASKKGAPDVDADEAEAAAAGARKRAKLSSASAVTVPQKGPLAMINAHAPEGSATTTAAATASATTTSVAFHPSDPTVAYSASTDHTLRTLDLATARVVSTLTTLHPLLAVAPLPRSSHSLVAAASAARHVSLLDPRVGGQGTTSVLTLRGHGNMVSSIAPAPDNDYSLVSGSHDGTCKVWDLRSVRPARRDEGGGGAAGGSVCEPAYTIVRESLGGSKKAAPLVGGEGVKVFDVKWDATWGIVSGGEDKRVQVNRGRDLLDSEEGREINK